MGAYCKCTHFTFFIVYPDLVLFKTLQQFKPRVPVHLSPDSFGIITYCNINPDKMSLNLPVLVALLNVIPSAVAGNIVPYSLLEMRLGRH